MAVLNCSFQPGVGRRVGCDPDGIEHLGTLYAGEPAGSLAEMVAIFAAASAAYGAYAPRALEHLLEASNKNLTVDAIKLIEEANRIASVIASEQDDGSGHWPAPIQIEIKLNEYGFEARCGSGRSYVLLEAEEPQGSCIGRVRISVLARKGEDWPENPAEHWEPRLRPLLEAAKRRRQERDQVERAWFREQVVKHTA